MDPYLALAAALPVETGALLVLWSWRRSRSARLLAFACLGAIAFVFLLLIGAPALSGRIAAGFFGMYIFSALLWAWWRNGLRTADRGINTAVMAALAAGLFSIAASAI